MDKITRVNFKNLSDNVISWGYDKGIIKKNNSFFQYQKVIEEMGEIGSAMFHDDKDALIDGIGDLLVTLIINAEQNGVKVNYDSIIVKKISVEESFSFMVIDVGNVGVNKTTFNFREAINSVFNFANSKNLSGYECLKVAYNVISNRKTKTVNGKVLKV